jgi:hypothetical protein
VRIAAITGTDVMGCTHVLMALSQKLRDPIARKIRRLAARYQVLRRVRMPPRVRGKLILCKQLHRRFSRKQETLSLGEQYWKDAFLSNV